MSGARWTLLITLSAAAGCPSDPVGPGLDTVGDTTVETDADVETDTDADTAEDTRVDAEVDVDADATADSAGDTGTVADSESDADTAAPPVGTCADPLPLACGAVVTGDTAAAGDDDLDGYGCAPTWDEAGPERVYALRPPGGGEITVTLDAAADLDLFALADTCAAPSCAAAANEALTFYADAGSTWFVVVDGYGGAAGGYTLTVTCDADAERLCADDLDGDGDGFTDCDDGDCLGDLACRPVTTCAADGAIGCGQVLRSTTAGLGSEVHGWLCAPWDAGGDEVVRTFTASADATVSVQVRADDPADDLDVYVLGDACAADRCLTFGDSTASFAATAGQTYHLVVDAPSGVAGAFALGVSCDGLALELACDDGADDDGDGLSDCADPDCAGALAACPPPAVCGTAPGVPLTCATGERVVSTVGAFDGVSAWPCAAADTSGPEIALPMTVDAVQEVTVWLDSEADLALLVAVGACDETACAAYGDGSVRFVAAPGEDTFVVVEGHAGAAGEAILTVACADAVERACADGADDDRDGDTDCADADCAGALTCLPSGGCAAAATLTCGGQVSGDTATSSAAVPLWSCVSWDERGPELAYAFTATTETGVRLALDAPDADLDLIVTLDGCDADSCLAAGDDALAWVAEPGVDYLVVVDGYAGAAGAFTLSATCAPVGPEDCDAPADEDFDGRHDCDDPDCFGLAACAPSCPEDAWEPADDVAAGAAHLAPGEAQAHSLCPWGDVDWSAFALAAPADVVLAASHDVALSLYDGDGGLVEAATIGRLERAGLAAGTYRVRVAGNARPDYTLQLTLATACPTPTPLACGAAPLSGTTSGGASQIDHYACRDGLAAGPEVVYAVATPEAGEVTFALLAAAPGLALQGFGATCSSGACVAGAADHVAVPAAAGETVHVVVDGPEAGAFTLAVVCPGAIEQACADGWDDDLDGLADCDDLDCLGHPSCRPAGLCTTEAVPIGCGDAVVGATAGGPEDLVGYACAPGFATGPEAVYAFTAAAAQAVTATLEDTGGTGLLGLYALADFCQADACAAAAAPGGGALTFDAAAGETWYLVADGLAGAAGAFTLTLACDPPRERDCADGLDDDGDGPSDCADGDCAGDLACGGVTCAPGGALACGSIIFGTTAAGASDLADYSCLSYALAGPEVAYDLAVAEDQEITLSLTDLSAAGLALLVLGGECRTTRCALWGPSHARLVAAAGAELVVVVDGVGAAGGEFLLRTECAPALFEDCDDGVDNDDDGLADCADVDCVFAAACAEAACADGVDDDGDGLTDCADPDCDDACLPNTCAALGAVACGETVAGTTVGGANGISHYPSCVSANEAGPEAAWSFTAPAAGAVTVTLEVLDVVADLDLFVLDGACAAAGCVAAGTDYAGESVTFEAAAAGTYHLVVDGPWGGSADYRLSLSCGEGE